MGTNELTIIPFSSDENGLAALKALQSAFANIPDDEFETGMKPSFGVLRFAGKNWAITQGGERTEIMDPADPSEGARAVNIIVLRATPGMSKTFYAGKYDPASPPDAPDCSSIDGIKPVADAKAPQCDVCAKCPQNAWGSRITDNGSKGKACSDHKRMVVVMANPLNLDAPLLLSVPPDSLKAWDEVVKKLKASNLRPNAVVMKLGFDREAVHPKLTWTPVGMIPAALIPKVQAARDSETALAIVSSPVQTDALPAPAPTAALPAPTPEVAPAAAPAPAPAAEKKSAPKSAPKAAPAPEPEAAPVDDEILSGIDNLLGMAGFPELA